MDSLVVAMRAIPPDGGEVEVVVVDVVDDGG
jgi:hypothetical protein